MSQQLTQYHKKVSLKMLTRQVWKDIFQPIVLVRATAQHCCATSQARQHYLVELFTWKLAIIVFFDCSPHAVLWAGDENRWKKQAWYGIMLALFLRFSSLALYVVSFEQNKRNYYFHASHTKDRDVHVFTPNPPAKDKTRTRLSNSNGHFRFG